MTDTTTEERKRGKTPTFSTWGHARVLPPPEEGFIEYPCEGNPGLVVRVMSPRQKDGKSRRTWLHRWKETDPVTGKSATKRKPLGLVVPFDGEEALDFEKAKKAVQDARVERRFQRSDGKTGKRFTFADAWAEYSIVKPLHRDQTKEKNERIYNRYFPHLKDRYLDELDDFFWLRLVQQLKDGTMRVGSKTNEEGREYPDTRGPLAADSIIGVLNCAALLYEIAHKGNGLQAMAKDANPARDAKAAVGARKKRKSRIPVAKLGLAWRAADQLMSPWWRDQFRFYLLTGLRRTLLNTLRFDEIDFRDKAMVFSPNKTGTKRRKSQTEQDPENLRLPLSEPAFAIIQARYELAPDREGPVWYSPKPTRGRARKDATLSDPRAAWTTLEDHLDLHFMPSDLRRTFATVGFVAKADAPGLSLLMLHTSKTLADTLGVPAITTQYIQTEEAQERMREAAETVAAKLLQVAQLSEEEAAKLPEPQELPAVLEEALAEDGKDEA